jgi:hypothetical protein
MPKTEIDYSNTIIYKITCKDTAVTDVYVGHTTNFVQRKHAHKQSCIKNTCKVYEVIRANGGWNNWKMEIINFFDCRDHYEARKKEQEYFISLNANLNSIEPMPKPKPKVIEKKEKPEKEIFFCNTCNMHCSNIKLFEEHNKTKKHLNKVEGNTKKHTLFNCEKCQFNCDKKSNYDKHVNTRKHNSYIELQTVTNKNIKKNICICGKIYEHRQGLYTHKLKCAYKNELIKDTPPIENDNNITNLVMELIKSNAELKKQLVDIIKNNTNLKIT